MILVHIHVGPKLPKYFWDTARQNRAYFSGPIYLVVSESVSCERACKALGISRITYESLERHANIAALDNIALLRERGMFWHRTLLRLFVLEALMQTHGLRATLHLENDVVLYIDPARHRESFRSIAADAVALNPVGPGHATAAYLYADTPEALALVNEQQLEWLRQGPEAIRAATGSDEINEMVLLKLVADRHPELVRMLPTLPDGPWSAGLDVFGSLFDGASWGQFVGGTPEMPRAGQAFPHHWVGRELRANRYGVDWRADAQRRMVPWVFDTHDASRRWPLNNLHVHNKRIGRYTRRPLIPWLNAQLYPAVWPDRSTQGQ